MNLFLAEKPLAKEEFYSPEDLALIHPDRIPRHVAIIQDGNRRWAREAGFPYMMGHWKGAETITRIVQAASRLGIKTLTVYSFSTENWGRSQEEVDALMDLFQNYLIQKREMMIREGVKLGAIGDIDGLPSKVKEALSDSIEATRHCDKIDLVLALNYGGRDDIRRAVLSIIEDCESGKISKRDLSEEMISRYLDTAKWEDPQLLIRTSGEKRLSNFLLWQVSYTEVYTTNTLWPEFTEKDLLRAVIDYQQRKRRWGG